MASMIRNLPLGELLSLGAQLGADVTPDALMQEVADAIHAVLGHPHVYVRLRNADTDVLEACAFAGLTAAQIARLRAHPTPPSFYQHVLHPRYLFSESYFIPARQPVEAFDFDVLAADQVHGALLVPLRGRGDRLLGAIYVVLLDDPRALPATSIQQLEVVARQAALALENARLAAHAARLLSKEQLLVELGRDVSTTLDLQEILDRTVRRLKRVFVRGSIALLNGRDDLEIVASFGNIDEAARDVRLHVGEGINGWVVQHGLPFLTNDVLMETRVRPAARDTGTNRLIRAYIAVPVRSGGKIIGTLSVEADQVNAFTFEDVDVLEAVAAQIGGPLASARLYEQAQRLAAEVERRNEQLTVLNAIARSAVSSVNLDWMLSTVADQIQYGFGYDHVELYLTDEDTQELVLAARSGSSLVPTAELRQPLMDGLLGRAYRTNAAVRIDDLQRELDYGHTDEQARSKLCVPISASGRVLAILNLESERVGAFTGEDVSVLQTAADMLANAIESARRYRRAQEAAVLEERSRLARDLHDSISQQLFSMTLTAQAARAQLSKNPERTGAQLERLQETATAALTEMRALIFQLRPPGLAEQGLSGALQRYVAALGRREGLAVNLSIAGDERNARGVDLALYRIVQEALNNVVRHAHACAVEIDLSIQPDVIQLRIKDDGCGFDPAAVQPSGGQHLGLVGMRERAAELNGMLAITSQPGQGTEIVVVVPGRVAAPGGR